MHSGCEVRAQEELDRPAGEGGKPVGWCVLARQASCLALGLGDKPVWASFWGLFWGQLDAWLLSLMMGLDLG